MTIYPLNKMVLRTFAVLGIVMGLVVLYLSARGPSSFPERQALTSATGTVAWTAPDRYGIKFGMEGDARTFSYARRSGDLALVASALADSADQPITVLVPQQVPSSAPFQVYEVTSSKGPLRTLSQTHRSWRADYRYGYLAALLAFLAAGFLEYVVRRSQPNNSFKPNPLRGSA